MASANSDPQNSTHSTWKSSVFIIGGGLAGLAAASVLAPRGMKVTLFEAKGRLGGRAGSFTDPATGQMIDTCQHVSMGCCTTMAHFCRTVGIDHLLQAQPSLFFMTPDRQVSRMAAGRLPAPFHLARSFLRAHYLTWREKWRIVRGLARLRKEDPEKDPPFMDWLTHNQQTPRTISRFWGLVVTSALNETPDRIGLRYARKVFLDGFLNDRKGFEIELPKVPLGRLYGEELQNWFHKHGVRILLNQRIKGFRLEKNRIGSLEIAQEEPGRADWYIAAVPFNRLLNLLPAETVAAYPAFANLPRLETSPITSVHLWYKRPVLDWPHLVLVECVGQWVFNRGEVVPGEYYVQVVVSAARQFRGLGQEEIRRRVVEELAQLFPGATADRLIRARVVTEPHATFSALPGVDQWRPPQTSPIENLFLAGDWTATGWPATMEGAVRSGYLAAQGLLRRMGKEDRSLPSDLGCNFNTCC
ncbi:MAG TPA: hydroxysqualene dehydroxylase HpnE [Gemmataceae bacterium]|nr:hydroxysqualene dehydroxylase HpnE [Gemmataceae bacterium]